MAARRPEWQKYVRVGGFLLVFVLFAPVLGIFLIQTLTVWPHRSTPATGQGAMMGLSAETESGFIGRGKMMWGAEPNQAPVTTDMMMTMPAIPSSIAYDVTDRQVVKSASLDLRARSLSWTTNQIQSIVKNVGGYVENANTSQPQQGVRTAWLSIRVPVDRLDATLDDVKNAASAVVSENMSAGDVTDQSIDLSARLDAKRAEEGALVLLLNKATKVSEIIEVTERLSSVRSEIERLQAEQRSLTGQVAMASITISITEDPRIITDTDPIRDGNIIKRSVTDLARWGVALGSALLAIVISGVPILVVYGFFLWLFYRFGRMVARRIVGGK